MKTTFRNYIFYGLHADNEFTNSVETESFGCNATGKQMKITALLKKFDCKQYS